MNQEELMAKWLPVKKLASHIFTWTGDGEMAYLAEMATKAKRILEIGTHMGASAFTMLTANPLAEVYCVDPFIYTGTYEVSLYFLRPFIQAGTCHIVRLPSREGVPSLSALYGTFDFVFIDGDHRYESALEDIRLCLPLLRPKGVLSGHDYHNVRPPDFEVKRAVDEVLPNHTSPVPNVWEFIVE